MTSIWTYPCSSYAPPKGWKELNFRVTTDLQLVKIILTWLLLEMCRISPLRYSQSFCNSSRNLLRWTIYQLWPPSSQNSQQKECKLHNKSVVNSTKRPKVLLLKQKISLLYLPLGLCPITRPLVIGKISEKLFGPGRPTHDHDCLTTKNSPACLGLAKPDWHFYYVHILLTQKA